MVQAVIKNAPPYQPMSAIELKVSVMRGMAVLIILRYRPIKNMARLAQRAAF